MDSKNDITNDVKFAHRFVAGVNTRLASAECLHKWLGVNTPFRKWIERRIADYKFDDNEDYLLVNESNSTRGRPKKVYWLTLDMAKELSMLEKNEKGRSARKYFLECEKAAKEAFKQSVSAQLPVIQDVSVKQAQIVFYYANGDIENKPFTEESVNLACSHLMPESVLLNKNRVASLWSDIGRSVKGLGVLS